VRRHTRAGDRDGLAPFTGSVVTAWPAVLLPARCCRHGLCSMLSPVTMRQIRELATAVARQLVDGGHFGVAAISPQVGWTTTTDHGSLTPVDVWLPD